MSFLPKSPVVASVSYIVNVFYSTTSIPVLLIILYLRHRTRLSGVFEADTLRA